MVRNIELEQLVINKLTQEQFDNIEVKNPDELYFVTDAEIDGGKGAQVEEMPEATEMNAGQIVQYVGETIPDIEATATITQTVGDSLTDLKVNAKKFEKASGLTEAGSLEFVADVYNDYGEVSINAGNCSWFMSGTAEAIINAFNEKYGSFNDFQYAGYIVYQESSGGFLFCPSWDPNNGGIWISCTKEELESFGFQFDSNVFQHGDFKDYFYSPGNGITINWKKDAFDVGINQYGISYSGTPSNGDTIKVDYTPFVGGYEKGYFYVNQAQVSEESIEIAQTVGGSLSALKVDAKKFIETEQPIESMVVDFIATSDDNTASVVFSSDSGLEILATPEGIHRLFWEKIGTDLNDPNVGSDNLYIDYFNDNDMGVGVNGGINFYSNKQELESYGITFTGNPSQGAVAIGVYTPGGGVSWSKDGVQVKLSDYGITYNGSPQNNDTITVTYSAPNIEGYVWNQINVQPASKGNGGIEWVTKLDLPADYPEQYTWSCYPIWTIPGGIPDGTYEFYIQTLCGTDAGNILAGIQNYTCKIKVRFYTENSTRRYIGSVSYVLDGSWTGDGNLRVEDNTQHFTNFFKIINDTDLCFYSSSRPFSSSVLGYITLTQAIPEIFKITAFKNIHTGELYYPQGQIYDGTNIPLTYTNISGSLTLEAFSNPISYPYYFRTYYFTINKNLKHICMSPQMLSRGDNNSALAGKITIYIESDTGGKFSAIIDNSNPSKSMIYGLESTGDLSDVQIGTGSDTSYTYINLNPQNKQFQRIKGRVALTSPSNTRQSLNLWYQDGMQALDTFTPCTITKVSGDIDMTNIGTILQYTHETTEDYTQGYFYKAVGETSIAPASVDVTHIGQEGIQITVNDPDALVEKLSQLSGWDKNSIIEHINYGWYWWQYTENYIHWDLFGSYHDAELVNCFTVTPVENLDNGILSFNLGNFSPSHEIVTNGRWEQVNTQPASNTVQVTEIPEASEENVGKILQYIGTPTSEYDQGYFYKCTADGWTQVNVQPSSGGGGEAPSELPNLTGNEGRFLSNNGSELEWADVPVSLPNQTGNAGKYLTTDGETASWVEIELPESTDGVELPDQAGNSGKFLTTDGANLSWAEVSSGGGTVSGDYLPLSGGTLTGPLKFENAMSFKGDVTLKVENWGAYGGDRFFIENAVLVVDGVRPSTSGLVQLGVCKEPENQIYPEGEFFSRVCTKALNNGTYQDDIIIPEKSGTLALIEDIEAVMGDLSSALDAINGEEI
jgi:hypothetical protein